MNDHTARKLPSQAPGSGTRARNGARYALVYRGRQLPLVKSPMVVGRASSCDLVLDSALVSRRHAQLVLEGDTLRVEDLGSRNGVLLNGRSVKGSAVLSIGDQLTIGDETLELVTCTEHKDRGTHITTQARTIAEERPISDIEEIRRAPPDSDNSAAYTRKADAFALLGAVVDKSLALGRGEEAERLLGSHLDRLLQQSRQGTATTPENIARAGQYAVRLAEATGKPRWIDFTIELYTAAAQPLPLTLVDELYRLLRSVRGVNHALLRRYVATLRTRAAELSPSERFVLQRVEGLERLASL